MEFVDNCYLIKHSQGWLLWDTGVTDAIAAMPDGQKPADARATHWKRPKTLASQLEQLGVKPADIKYVAVSHTHPDHIGNITMFPNSIVLVQKAEYDWPSPFGRTLQAGASAKLEGDHDVFGAGSVTLIATPGHTPGHQSLLVNLPKTGALLRATPSISRTIGKTAACRTSISIRSRPPHRCSAWPRSSPRRRRNFGLTTTRRNATA
jgi:N-acyl homoserine lactone hydrolase